jgi:DNA-binding NtrC family response regulator
VARGRFREDLFYRLHVIPIHVPPLRERDDDVLAIARKFLIDIAREEGKAFTRFAPDTEAVFRAYSWPGNVRQLQNVVRNTVVLNAGEVVTLGMLPAPLDPQGLLAGEADPPSPDGGALAPGAPARPVNGDEAAADPQRLIRPLAEVEKSVIEQAISLCDGNIPKAAAHLCISASTIYRKRANWGNVGNRA